MTPGYETGGTAAAVPPESSKENLMYDSLGKFELGAARLTALLMADEIVERLDHACEIREEQLFALAILGWTEDAFIDAAYGQKLDDE